MDTSKFVKMVNTVLDMRAQLMTMLLSHCSAFEVVRWDGNKYVLSIVTVKRLPNEGITELIDAVKTVRFDGIDIEVTSGLYLQLSFKNYNALFQFTNRYLPIITDDGEL